ncbi:MAG: M3 family metallopeptidase [Deltaproteobacteria bacterium]|jgi:oligoendopeptidase F|nr:M3 family metallopeptidase [Deltaproteobacteria bacterium]
MSDLYYGISDIKVQNDFLLYQKLTIKLHKRYRGKLTKLKTQEAFKMFQLLEARNSVGRKICRYAYLYYILHLNDLKVQKFYQGVVDKMSELDAKFDFIPQEILLLSEKTINLWLKDRMLHSYAPAIKYYRRFQKFQVPDEVNKVLIAKNSTSTDAFVRLYHECFERLWYRINGRKYNFGMAEKIFTNSRGAARKRISDEFVRVYKENAQQFAFIYNVLMRDKAINDGIQNLSNPVDSINLWNDIDNKSVEVLTNTVVANYRNISQRFFKLKAKLQKQKQIPVWEVWLPVSFAKTQTYPFEVARKIILNAFHKFSPKLFKIANVAFKDKWIDAEVRAGKLNGAMALDINSSHHPYVMLNYHAQFWDLRELAHELGHACHFVLYSNQSILNNNTPPILAEVASVFCEHLVYDEILRNVKDDKEKLALLLEILQNKINISLRQIAFHLFESRAYAERKKGELSAERIAEILHEEESKYYGSAVKLRDEPSHWWISLHHIFDFMFYCYSYSFAGGIVNSLYKVYCDKSVSNFENKYLNMLSETGIKNYKELLKPFGLDPTKNDFWQQGLNVISDYLDEAEKLSRKLKL